MVDVEQIIKNAESFLGTKFLPQGRNEFGIDCSGLFVVAANQSGLMIPDDRTINAISSQRHLRMYHEMRDRFDEIPTSEARRGDLLVFWFRSPHLVAHSAIYLGGDKIIHALNEEGVRVTVMQDDLDWTHVFAAFRFRPNQLQANHMCCKRILSGRNVVFEHDGCGGTC